MPPPVKMMMIKTMTPMIVNTSISILFYFQVLEALAQSIEQRFALVGFGCDNKTVRGLTFHANNIATIVDRIRTYEQLHQHLLWHVESQLISRSAKLLAEVINELFHRIKRLGIACKCVAEFFWTLFTWVVYLMPLFFILLRNITGKVKIMLCLSFIDEDTILLITPHALAVERVGCILVTFVA